MPDRGPAAGGKAVVLRGIVIDAGDRVSYDRELTCSLVSGERPGAGAVGFRSRGGGKQAFG